MRILATTFVYNECPYIEEWVKWYRSQGCELFILDNYSNDGTWEWLQENNIPCDRVDSGGAFDLRILQFELNKHIHRIKPDWVVYSGADLFQTYELTVKETILLADFEGYNQLLVECWGALNTGEKFKLPLQNNFLYGVPWKNIVMVSKYDKGFMVSNDNILLDKPNPLLIEGIMINYGACKPKAEQEEKLKRRQKAWDLGLNRSTGRHFTKGKAKNWEYSKDKAIYMPDNNVWQYVKKLCR